MPAYITGGALIGLVIGYLIPPGHIFWFSIGAICGWIANRYLRRMY